MAFATWNSKKLYCPACANQSGHKERLTQANHELVFRCSYGHKFTPLEIAELKRDNLVEVE